MSRSLCTSCQSDGGATDGEYGAGRCAHVETNTQPRRMKHSIVTTPPRPPLNRLHRSRAPRCCQSALEALRGMRRRSLPPLQR